MPQPSIRLHLEIEPRHAPIRGVLDDGHGERRPFEGWMELAAVLQRYCDGDEPAADTSDL